MWVAASAWVSRIITAGVQLASIRLLLDQLGVDDFAAFTVLGSVTAWLLMVDLGSGVTLQNKISECRSKAQSWASYRSLAVCIAGLSAMLCILLCIFFSPLIGSALLKEFPKIGVGDKPVLFLVVALSGIVQALGSIQYRIWYAMHKGYWASILPALAAIVVLTALITIGMLDVGKPDRLFWCLLAYVLPPAIFPLCMLLYDLRDSKYRFKMPPRGKDRKIFFLDSAGFFFFGLMASGVLQIDYFVMAQYVNSAEITQYNIVSRIFSLVFFIYNAVVLALWPVCAEALAGCDYEKVRGYIKKYIPLGVGFVLVSTCAIAVMSPWIVAVLAPKSAIELPVGLIFICGIYFCLRVWTDTFAMVLQSINELRTFWIFTPLQALASLVFQVVFAPKFGAIGIVIGLILSFLLTVFWALPRALSNKFAILSR